MLWSFFLLICVNRTAKTTLMAYMVLYKVVFCWITSNDLNFNNNEIFHVNQNKWVRDIRHMRATIGFFNNDNCYVYIYIFFATRVFNGNLPTMKHTIATNIEISWSSHLKEFFIINRICFDNYLSETLNKFFNCKIPTLKHAIVMNIEISWNSHLKSFCHHK